MARSFISYKLPSKSFYDVVIYGLYEVFKTEAIFFFRNNNQIKSTYRPNYNTCLFLPLIIGKERRTPIQVILIGYNLRMLNRKMVNLV